MNENDLVVLTNSALKGCTVLGAALGLNPATLAGLTTDLEAFAGRPAVAGPPARAALAGKQSEHFSSLSRLSQFRAAFRDQKVTATKYCAKAIDTLKGTFGRSWNPQWAALGFTTGSLELKRMDPAAILTHLAAYLRQNPDQENTPSGITAALAQAQLDALEAARAARWQELAVEGSTRQARKTAAENLRGRLRVLRSELELALADNDARWYQFGFTRPADSHLPGIVTALEVRPNGPGSIVILWAASPLAVNYRVRWRLNLPDSPMTDAGLFTDRVVTLNGLPNGKPVIVSVTARNKSGETQPTEVPIAVQ